MKQNYTHLSILADRSGSMAHIAKDSQGGINTLIKDQAALPGEITVSLYQFDTHYEKVFGPIAAAEAPIYILTARGGTALLDSAYKAVVDTGHFLNELPEDQRPEKVLFVIVTDGEENSSKKISTDQLKNIITQQTNTYNWEFTYIGANVDAFSEAHKYGVTSSIQYAATGASASSSYMNLSSAITHTRSTDATMDSFIVDNNDVDAEGKVTKRTTD